MGEKSENGTAVRWRRDTHAGADVPRRNGGPRAADPNPNAARERPGSRADNGAPIQDAPWSMDAMLRRLESIINTRRLSPRTRDTYLGWIRRYLRHNGCRHPASLGRVDVERFLQHLAEELDLGPDALNLAASSISFLYRELWGIDIGAAGLRRAKQPGHLPKNASAQDVDRVLAQLRGIPRVAAIIMYGSGARVSETLGIRIKDLDLDNRELSIRHGKGGKDRVTVLPRAALEAIEILIRVRASQHAEDLDLGQGWAPLPGAMHRKDPRAGWELGWQFLFPSPKPKRDAKTRRLGRGPLHATTIQRAVKQAVRRAGVPKQITCHVFRHCFATEMIRAGCDIKLLQKLMGHSDLRTTAKYLHVVERPGLAVESPFDRLPSVRDARRR
jgi:integron integrase